MAKLKIGDRVKLNVRAPFGDWERSEAVVTQCANGLYEVGGDWFVQGGDDCVPNGHRDRFYRVSPEVGCPYFTRV